MNRIHHIASVLFVALIVCVASVAFADPIVLGQAPPVQMPQGTPNPTVNEKAVNQQNALAAAAKIADEPVVKPFPWVDIDRMKTLPPDPDIFDEDTGGPAPVPTPTPMPLVPEYPDYVGDVIVDPDLTPIS